MNWRYRILKKNGGFTVCEEYDNYGFTDEVAPCGGTPEELVKDLEAMIKDVERDIEEKQFKRRPYLSHL